MTCACGEPLKYGTAECPDCARIPEDDDARPSEEQLRIAAETLRRAIGIVLEYRLTSFAQAELGAIAAQLTYALNVAVPRHGEIPAGLVEPLTKLASQVRTLEETGPDDFYGPETFNDFCGGGR